MTWQKGNPGRPKGSKNRVSAVIAKTLVAERKSPLEVMLRIQDYYFEIWEKAPKDNPEKRFAAELAMNAAQKVAPYCHAKLSPAVEEEDDGKLTIELVHSQRPVKTNGHAPNGHGNGSSNGSGGQTVN